MPHYQQARVAGPFDPLSVVARTASSGLVTGYVVYERADRWYLAGNPLTEVRVFPGATDDPWAGVSRALADAPVDDWRAYGWACFELAGGMPAPAAQPLVHMMVPRLELEITSAEVLVRSTDEGMLGAARALLGTVPRSLLPPEPRPVPVDGDGDAYRAMVADAVSEIGRRRLEKVILSRRVEIPFPVDLTATYVLGRRHNTPARSFLLDLGGWRAAGFSPETVVEVDTEATATTQPLAGTRALTGDPTADGDLRDRLATDPKEVYEHAASIRLAFAELSSVGRPGTTRVNEFLTVRQRGSVQHLASRVATDLRPGYGGWDALAAVFPAVTASGIPKDAACALVGRLEREPRGLYSGTVLMAGADGSLDAALVLRAVYQHGGRAWLQAGAGVVSVSTPDREYEETCEKLRSVAPYVVEARPGRTASRAASAHV